MINLARRQALTIWIAILAILFSAFAPAVSHALNASASQADMVEICTANGYQLVKVPGSAGGEAPASASHGMKHCAFCATHAGSHALPVGYSSVIVLDAGRTASPPLFYAAPLALHAWSAASPRGPPPFA